MPRISRTLGLLAAAAAPLLLAACSNPPPLYVDQAWVRISPNPESPSAGYFTVHGGPEPVQLRDVITDRALRVELHESLNEGGRMTMKQIDAVDVPAKTQVAFAPGGKHLMLFGVNPAAVEQGKIPLTFLFSNGDRIIVDAVIQKAGAPAPDAKAGANTGNAAEHGAH